MRINPGGGREVLIDPVTAAAVEVLRIRDDRLVVAGGRLCERLFGTLRPVGREDLARWLSSAFGRHSVGENRTDGVGSQLLEAAGRRQGGAR